jgi:hypothetical protein
MVSPNRFFVCIALCVMLYPPFSYGKGSKKSDVLNHLSSRSGSLHYSLFNWQSPPTKQLLAILDHQVQWDNAIPSDPSSSGLPLRFEKIDGTVAQSGRVTERYRFFAEGANENKVFALRTWLVDNTLSADTRDIYVNTQGLLMIHKPKPGQEMILKAGDDELVVVVAADNAEPVRFVLASRDGETQFYGTLVPHPLAADEQGCKLEVRIAQPDASAVLVIADGFPAKAKIPLVLESAGSVDSEVLTTNSDGHAEIASFPLATGKDLEVIKASAEGPGCLPSVVLQRSAAAHAAPKTPEH